MALLVELTINGETVRVSNEAVDLTHYWDPYISRAGSIKWVMATEYGGYVKTKFSDFRLLPKTFADYWPAPESIGLKIKYTETNEESAVLLFAGTGHTSGLDRQSNEYELFGEEIDVTVTDEVFNDTLVNIFTTYTGGSYLNLLLNTDAARASSPAVKYTSSGERQLLDVLSDIAKFFTHSFYIQDGTLYLIDMLADNGSTTITEFDFKPIKYIDPVPVSVVAGDQYSVNGSYSYGDVVSISPVCHDTQANIETALGDIKTLLESRGANITIPINRIDYPVIGEKLSWTDESFDQDIDMFIRAHGIIYDFDRYEFTVEGRGSIS